MTEQYLELDTPLPMEEMYGYVVRIKSRDKWWYCYVDTILLEEAKMKGKIKFIRDKGSNINIQKIQCKQIMWLDYINPEPYETWHFYKTKCIL
jgi:hypothetical protein